MIYICTTYRRSGRDFLINRIPFDAARYNDPEAYKTEIEQVEWVDNYIAEDITPNLDVYIVTNSVFIFNAFRIAINDDRLDNNIVQAMYVDVFSRTYTMTFDEKGTPDQWPDGWFDVFEKQLVKML